MDLSSITLNTQTAFYLSSNSAISFKSVFTTLNDLLLLLGRESAPAEMYGTIEAYELYLKTLNDFKDSPLSLATYFSPETPAEVRFQLELARANETRIRLWLGDVKTGMSWMDEYDVVGRVGRSTGTLRVPLLISSSRSSGGGAILTHCIVRIDSIQSRRTLYQHPEFHVPPMEKVFENPQDNRCTVRNPESGVVYARFRDEPRAQRWIDFLNGHSYRK